MTIKIPGLNVENGLDLFDGDTELYLIVLRSFAANTPTVLEKLRSVSAETLAAYSATVHGLKGTSMSIGADDIGQTAKRLEALSKAGDLAGVQALNESFLKQVGILVKEIQAWLEKNASES